MAAIMLITVIPCSAVVAFADEAETAQTTAGDLPALEQSNDISYTAYSAQQTADDATEEVKVAGQSYTASSGSVVKEKYYEREAAKITAEGSTVTYNVTVPQDALYAVVINYCAVKNRNNPISMGLKIDGKTPFVGADAFELPRLFVNDGDTRTDGLGNEFSPAQIETYRYTDYYVKDASGLEQLPYKFYLSAGVHTLTFTVISEYVAISEIRLEAPIVYRPYEEVSASYPAAAASQIIKIEGEDAEIKSTYSIIGKSDQSEPRMSSKTPQSTYLSRVNYIGNTNWQMPGEKLTWTIEVPADGLYKVGFKARQNYILNGNSYRKLSIDGKVPFAEAATIAFPYDINWKYIEWANDKGEPYQIYLTAGKHEVSLEVELGEMTESVRRLQTVLYNVGALYRKIVMITGETVDANRDYELFNQIPGFTETLTACRDELKDIANEIEKISGTTGNSNSSTIRALTMVMDKMLEFPYSAHTYKSLYYTNYTSCASLVYEMMKMAISLDYFEFVPVSNEYDHNQAGFFEGLWFGTRRFISSFSEDYDNISGDIDTKDSILIWVNWGRDQVRVLNDLIQSSFTPQTGIGVNLKISNASYIQGILSGNAPDCSLHMARSEPVNLALRNSMVNLKEFPDYEQVIKRFISADSVLPYQFQGGTYALPDTQSYYMMFYRKDIFEENNLTVPKTWQDYIDVSSYLMRNNLQASLPYIQLTAMTQVNAGVGAFSIFPTLLLQKGCRIYNDNLSATDLVNGTALEMFEFWTDFYNEYKFPVTADFFNRFRTGVMPIGIQSYSYYIQLTLAAPEISGKWAMAPIPGFPDQNGEPNNIQAGSGTGAGILKVAKNKKGGWEFIKWWTSAKTQLNYSNNCESILGVAGRVNTSNVEAFKQMGWDNDSLNALMSQWSKVHEINEVPGGYYTARVIDQAYWNVVNNGTNSKDTMIKWAQIADNEIARKRKQYNVQ